MKSHYDILIVGTGLYGAVFAHEAMNRGLSVLMLEKRAHIGGNVYTEEKDGITIHKYGAHIFHTSDKVIWDYVTNLVPFHTFINSPIANYKGHIYNMPFNMNTFARMWDISTPDEAKRIISEQRGEIKAEPGNLEEQAISLVGRDIYETLIKGYTEKQWGRPCSELPPEIIRRLPVRFTYDNNYFSDIYQGIPDDGYTSLIEKLVDGADIILAVDYLPDRVKWDALAERTLYTGPLDALYGYSRGKLEYRSEIFEEIRVEREDFQGNAVVNYTAREVPYTRIIEHKHFEFGKQEKTVISREYSSEWKVGMEPYYPVNNEQNNALFEKYRELADKEENVIFGGRLGNYKYYDMDKVIEAALELVEKEF